MIVFPSFLDAVLDGDVDYLDDTIMAVLTEGYTGLLGNTFLADVSPTVIVGAAVELTNKERLAGSGYADPWTFPAVEIDHTVTGVLIYQDTGDEATSHLISFHDRKADGTPISIETDDADIDIAFVLNRVFHI